MSEYFWEDAHQAQERLTGTVILYGDTPSYITSIEEGRDSVFAEVRQYPGGNRSRKDLADPLFHKFRKLPLTGWINVEALDMAMLVERRMVRRTRHGLNNENIQIGHLNVNGQSEIRWRDYNYDTVYRDKGYSDAHLGKYPTLEEVLAVLRPQTAIAISPMYAVYRDDLGLRWLYRYSFRVGLFPDNNSLLLIKSGAYLREELTESVVLRVDNIREF